MSWPEPNGHDEEFVPLSRRPVFRIVSLVVTVMVVLAMLAITLGPYLVDRRRPAPTTTTIGIQI